MAAANGGSESNGVDELREDAEKVLRKRLTHHHNVDSTRISFKIFDNNISLSLDSAISCGLILNELITTSLKYAFPEGRSGMIQVGFENLGGGELEMSALDDGVGMPAHFDFKTSDTLGVQIVHALAEHQLGGTIKLINFNGARYLIRFKERRYRGTDHSQTSRISHQRCPEIIQGESSLMVIRMLDRNSKEFSLLMMKHQLLKSAAKAVSVRDIRSPSAQAVLKRWNYSNRNRMYLIGSSPTILNTALIGSMDERPDELNSTFITGCRRSIF